MDFERAIVLCRKEHLCTLLTRNRGVVRVAAYQTGLILGSLIRCTLCKSGNRCAVQNVELLEVPFVLARDDLLFLHHILELCRAFIPQGARAPEVFDAVCALYAQRTCRLSNLCKKLFLCRLLICVGLYDSLPKIDAAVLETVLTLPVDMARWSTIDLDSQQELDAWLLACVAGHPQVEHFNTVHFLTGRR